MNFYGNYLKIEQITFFTVCIYLLTTTGLNKMKAACGRASSLNLNFQFFVLLLF